MSQHRFSTEFINCPMSFMTSVADSVTNHAKVTELNVTMNNLSNIAEEYF